jgi:hypothetical protein
MYECLFVVGVVVRIQLITEDSIELERAIPIDLLK